MDTDRYVKILSFAVENKKNVQFVYDGAIREVCPHLLGRTKDDCFVTHCFQYRSRTKTGDILNPENGSWKYFYLQKMSDLVSVPTDGWYPEDLPIRIKEYSPPAFIQEIIAISSSV